MTFQPLTAPTDYVLLAGKRSPGITEIVGAGSPRKWDERKGYGLSGSTLIFRGIGLAKFTIKIRLYTDADFEAWHAWAPLVQRPPLGTRSRALDVWHPILEDLGIRSLVVEDVLQPLQEGDGEWVIEIRCIEYRAPQPAIARPSGSQARPQPPTDPVDLFIERLSAQNQALARQL